ncbi:hypothetical protein [Thermoflexibacter ruber]|uniref:YD repeat-containing protein n=1 Tax=Thermoflexibacter ruber TaxID=1003 RepID=A0A1I2HG74_9BACT|nr:hypothetical protein [Thermoflexibacter ruber]SFF28403.1 hypothetical protein SAMN04488541_102379 [Thermoflexibacter ruber]
MKRLFLFICIISSLAYSCSLLNAPKIEEIEKEGTPENVIGKLKRRAIFPNLDAKNPIDEWIYEYNKEGVLEKMTRYDVNSLPKRIINYTTYEYDSAKRLKNAQLFARNINTSSGFSLTEERTYKYSPDSLSLLLEEIVSNLQNNTSRTFRYTYSNRRLIRMTNPALNPPGYVTFEYNGAGNKSRENRYSHLNLIYEYTTFTYSTDTLLTRSTVFDPDNSVRTIISYQYNKDRKRTLEEVRQQKLATNQSNYIVRYEYY